MIITFTSTDDAAALYDIRWIEGCSTFNRVSPSGRPLSSFTVCADEGIPPSIGQAFNIAQEDFNAL